MWGARVGLLGYGLAGRFFHAPLIQMTPGLDLVGVATSRTDQVADELPGVPVVAGLEELLAVGVDLCVVATPNRTHAALATDALAAGAHVVIDKPVARTAAEARSIAQAADDAGRRAIPFHNRRWDSDFLTLRGLLDRDELGTVWRLESRFERWRPELRGGWRELADPEEAGGVLLDLGPHLVDQALVLLGPVEDVHAELATRRPDAAVVDDAFLALRHRGGAVSHLWMSVTAAHAGPRLRVLGSRAAYVKHGLDPQEDALRAGAWSGVDRVKGERVAGEAHDEVPTLPGDWPAFYAGVAAAIADGAPAPVTMDEAIDGLEILDAARAAA
jgi:scyllo-inositol 2-dehydrogenase (NADP+)